MSFSFDQLARTAESNFNGVSRNAEQALSTPNGFLTVVGKTAAVALAAGLFAAVCGAGFFGTVLIMAVVGACMFYYTSSNYHTGHQIADTARAMRTDPRRAENYAENLGHNIGKKIGSLFE